MTATRLPFADGTFDAVTISFGLRNIVDPDAGLREMRRVTRPGGRLVVCEFSHPTWAPFRTVYIEYLMKALPAVARAVSSNPDAYVYLAESIRAWPDQAGLAAADRGGRLGRRPVAQPLRRHRRAAPRHGLSRHRGATPWWPPRSTSTRCRRVTSGPRSWGLLPWLGVIAAAWFGFGLGVWLLPASADQNPTLALVAALASAALRGRGWWCSCGGRCAGRCGTC